MVCDAKAPGLPYNDNEITRWVLDYHRTRDEHLRERIVRQMRPLVVATARRFRGGEPVEDLEAEAYIGLVRAIDRFSPSAGARFSTFATHLMTGAIRHYLRDRGHMIRQPAWLQELDGRVRKVSQQLEQRLGRSPDVVELAEAANVAEEGIQELLAARSRAQVSRLEVAEDDSEYLEVDPEKFRSKDYVSFELPIEDRVVLENAMGRLKELEQKVLRLFFFQDRNQSEIARSLGISCNYTGYVLKRGLKHMREGLGSSTAFAPPSCETAEIVDPLTGVFVASYFEQRVDEEVRRARAAEQDVSVSCLQVAPCSDGRFGEAAQSLRLHTRRLDVVARTGSRELAVLFPNTGPIAVEVTSGLVNHVEKVMGGRVLAATATYPYAGRTGRELFETVRHGLAVTA